MRILCDIDGILAPFTEHLIKGLKYYGEHYTIEDFTEYELKKVVQPRHHWILERLPSDKNFCKSLGRYPGAQQFLKDMCGRGHEVKLVTSPWVGPNWELYREAWVDSILCSPELRAIEWQWASPEERVQLEADFLIDDRQETIDMWKATGRPYACIKRPWNAGTVTNYGEVLHLIDFAQATLHS